MENNKNNIKSKEIAVSSKNDKLNDHEKHKIKNKKYSVNAHNKWLNSEAKRDLDSIFFF